MKHRSKFKIWLLKKYSTTSVSEAAQRFTKECPYEISHNTVLKWSEGSKPRKFYSDILRPLFPDCPLFTPKILIVPEIKSSQSQISPS